MTNSIKDAIFYHIYPLGFCGVINNKEKSTKNLGLNKIDKKLTKFNKNTYKKIKYVLKCKSRVAKA